MSNNQLAYLLTRFTLGVNFLFHGLVRLPKLEKFVSHISSSFEGTLFPVEFAKIFAYAIPFIEVLLGLFILLGIATRKSLVATAIFMMCLIIGSCFAENWPLVSQQMIYALFIFFLIKYEESNVWALTKTSKKQIDGFTTKK